MNSIIDQQLQNSRPNGYYWVKYTGEWIIAYWCSGEWFLIGTHSRGYDYEFDEIDERKITQWPLPSKCDHQFNATDENGFTICSICGDSYT